MLEVARVPRAVRRLGLGLGVLERLDGGEKSIPLARELGVGRSTIFAIKVGSMWADVYEEHYGRPPRPRVRRPRVLPQREYVYEPRAVVRRPHRKTPDTLASVQERLAEGMRTAEVAKLNNVSIRYVQRVKAALVAAP